MLAFVIYQYTYKKDVIRVKTQVLSMFGKTDTMSIHNIVSDDVQYKYASLLLNTPGVNTIIFGAYNLYEFVMFQKIEKDKRTLPDDEAFKLLIKKLHDMIRYDPTYRDQQYVIELHVHHKDETPILHISKAIVKFKGQKIAI